MNEQKCVFCPEYMDKKLFVYDQFAKLSWIVSHQFRPAFKYQLVITPKKHHKEITDFTEKEIKDLLVTINRLLLFFKPKDYVIFWFKGIGRTQEHFHIHMVFKIPDGFKNLPKPHRFISHETERRLPMPFLKELIDQNYTTVWTKKGINIYLREENDGLFKRSDKEQSHEHSYEQACEWAAQLKNRFADGEQT